MLAVAYSIVHRVSWLRALVRALLRVARLDISKVGNLLGLYNKQICRIVDPPPQMVNVGGGAFYKRGWGVLDIDEPDENGRRTYLSGTVDWSQDLAAVTRLPFADNSLRLMYSSHCLEHIPEASVRELFAEFHRCLRPGGTLHITVPDFDLGAAALRRRDAEFFAPLASRRCLANGGTEIEDFFVDYYVSGYAVRRVDPDWLNRSLHAMSNDWVMAELATRYPVPMDYVRAWRDHCSMWNFDKMAQGLRNAGFREVVRIQPGQSRDPEMRGHGLGWAFDNRVPEHSFFLEAYR